MYAEEIIVSGGSSGCTAAWVWMPYFQDYFPKNIKLWMISDSDCLLIHTMNIKSAISLGSACRFSQLLWKWDQDLLIPF